jgi:sugar phosphate isomerase/epimerase
MNTRRNFIRLAGAGVLAAGAVPVIGSSVAVDHKPEKRKKPVNNFTLGMAGYTFYQLPLDRAIEIMKIVNVTKLSLKDNFLPLDSNQETITSVLGKFRSAGIDVYTVGVIYMEDLSQVERAFEYARMAGVKMIVGAPNINLLPLVVDMVKKYNIRVAIHNHGPDNKLFPTATDIWDQIKNLHPWIGICLDIGHTVRAGQDPVRDVTRYASRIFDIHIKDVTAASKDGRTIEMGRGIIDIPAFVEALRKIDYPGMCSLEFEKDMKDPIAGIAESIGYFRGIMATSVKR